MSSNVPRPRPISRSELIDRLRTALSELTDEGTSICKVATERGFFCRGFAKHGDAQLRHKYAWIVRKRPGMTRQQLEEVANDWQLAQQAVHASGLACDVQSVLHDTCGGWDDFTDEQLAEAYREITGKEVDVLPG